MTPHPDKLFQERLEHYQKVAPASAWERIESGLVRKRRRSPWLKIAAGLFLVIATSVIIFQLNQTENTLAIVNHKSAAEQESDISFRESSDVSREAPVDHESSDVSREIVINREASGVRRSSGQSSVYSPQLAVGSQQSSVSSPQSAVDSQQSSVLSPQLTFNSGQSSTYTQTIEPVETKNEQPVAHAEITNESSPTDEALATKGTSITYSAEEVNAKYLKKESPPEATPEKKNTSGFQKVIDLALDFKSEGTVLGELREKKNELLSFNASPAKRELNK